jgi:pimeloyl-ACP methyl ester carboxylesterase
LPEAKSLEIKGYRSLPVRNTFFRKEGETDHLCIVYPGYGYGCSRPLLQYPTQLFLSQGADVLWVEYEYYGIPEYRSAQSEVRRKWLFADSAAALEEAVRQRPYGRLTLLGKSLGTLAIGHVLTSRMSSLTHAKVVWLTPLLTDPQAREMIKRIDNASLYVIGSADEVYDGAFVSRLEEKPSARVMVIDGADHSLEVADPVRSIDILKDIVEAIQEFVWR